MGSPVLEVVFCAQNADLAGRAAFGAETEHEENDDGAKVTAADAQPACKSPRCRPVPCPRRK
jgi:hypothetical protein